MTILSNKEIGRKRRRGLNVIRSINGIREIYHTQSTQAHICKQTHMYTLRIRKKIWQKRIREHEHFVSVLVDTT